MNLFNYFIPILFIAAIATFFAGVVLFAMKKNDEAGRKMARTITMFGGIAFLALVLIWGIAGYTQSSLGLTGSVTTMSPPSLNMIPGGYGGDSYGAPMAYNGAVAREAAYDKGIVGSPPVPAPGAIPPSGDAKIVKTGDLTLLVKNVPDAATAITQIRIAMGGQPGNASFNEYKSGVRSGHMTVWVPAERFDDAMGAVKKLAILVENENVTVQDVSAQYVDLTARLKTLQATEASYITLLQRAGKITEVLEVNRELNNTRTQIEQYKGQLDYLSHQIALSSIRVTLQEEATPGAAVTNEWRPWGVAKGAAKETLADLTRFADMLMVFLIKLPVALLYIGFWLLVAWVVYKIGRFVYVRLRSGATSADDGSVI